MRPQLTWLLSYQRDHEHSNGGLFFTAIPFSLANLGDAGQHTHHKYTTRPLIPHTSCRFFLTIFIAIFFSYVMWALGGRVTTQNGIQTSAGALYASTLFLGIINSISVQPIIAQQRGVMYREKAAGTYAIWPWYSGIVRPIPCTLTLCFGAQGTHSRVHGHTPAVCSSGFVCPRPQSC